MTDRLIEPLAQPPDAVVRPPGSKSITNRALITAALAVGVSHLDGVLFADDTEAMLAALASLGHGITIDRAAHRVTVEGRGPSQATGITLDARQSGTTSRFLLPLVALGRGEVTVTGEAPIRARPMGPLVDALRSLGADLDAADDGLPITVRANGLEGGRVEVPGGVSSQFLSALLLAAPLMSSGLESELATGAVSIPYIEMTGEVMQSFGAPVETNAGGLLRVAPGGYRATNYAIEPDASAASYFAAAAAMTGGRVVIEGLSTDGSMQGDMQFIDQLHHMGAGTVNTLTPQQSVEVTGHHLRGVTVDMRHFSDTAQTLAVVAAIAEGPTTITGIGFIRRKETDRIAAMVTELRRCGVGAEEHDDGLTVIPAPIQPAEVETYDDHRMAMSFALLGLVAPGIVIKDAECVSKTFPDFFEVLETIRR